MLDLVTLVLAATLAVPGPAAEPVSANVPSAASVKKAEKAPEKLPIETFSTLPFIEMARLSPDGTHIAGLFAVGNEQQIVISPLGFDAGKVKTVGIPDGTEINSIRWVNDDNILVGIIGLAQVQTDQWYITRMIAINRKTGNLTKLLWREAAQNAADVLWMATDGSPDILVAVQESIYSSDDAFWPTVYRLDVETGKKRVETKGKQYVMDWGADQSGKVRIGVGYNDRNQQSRLLYAQENSRSFRIVDRANLGEEEDLNLPFMFIPGTDNALVIKGNAQGKTAVIERNLLTDLDIRTVYEAQDDDVEGVVLSYDGSKLLGIRLGGKGKGVDWLDPDLKKAQEYLDQAAPMAEVRIQSLSHDQSKMLVHIGTSDNPGLIYYFDAKEQALEKFAAVNQAIEGRRLARAKYVQYKARDGLEIEGVLTLPRGREAKNLPLVVMPHGGPWAHDSLTYDYWAQFLADRGYAVLQPNFRGSTGYGDNFLKMGQGQLGFAMQDDLTDGIKWAVGENIADPARVCIVGASYGGYAAMWGIAKDPDLYRCAIAISGVSALRKEVNDFGGSIRENLYKGHWIKMTPDFNAVSPLYAVDRIKAPLLLIHGVKDVTVDHRQSVLMHKAMLKAGKSSEFVSLEKADHYFSRGADRLTLLQSMEAFLAKHNPAD
ncbi:alpha/beta hydrolase family protein [Allopontixanthobacter sp.]|uniref:alpha/beta hydrolase family protein n=1 Tax=Allopontixanthobacter sp. TaxID=2906452 RepID=UPI002ABA598D|nr:prolyl oligopeptidase family serine peptidase [Allopontixanthobacter sp.]MDZ4306952.1 prolyl oligopeptidase family serine peptidase [Allopontixanthobacter sp.]